jgi:uncharacterized membrane protein YczE
MNITQLFTKNMAKKICTNILGLLIMSLGISFTINSNLGVSPVTSFPYSIGLVLNISVGTMSSIVFALFIIMQIALLRRDFKWINVFQIVFTVIFGIFMDVMQFFMSGLTFQTYIGQFTMLIVGIIIISFGLSVNLSSNIMPLPPEGIVLAISKVTGKPFGILKVYFDSSLVLMSIAITWFFLGSVYGVREGTLISAMFIGWLVPLHRRWMSKVFVKKTNEEENSI